MKKLTPEDIIEYPSICFSYNNIDYFDTYSGHICCSWHIILMKENELEI